MLGRRAGGIWGRGVSRPKVVNAVRAGKIEVVGGLDALATFAPPSYFSMGATYAAIVLASEGVLSGHPGAVAWVFPSSVIVMCVVPSLVFLAVDPPTRALLRARVGVRS